MGLVSGPPLGGAAAGSRFSPAQMARELWGISSPGDLIPARGATRPGSVYVTPDIALRNSAVWACLRLRANLVSSFPVDVYRRIRVDGGEIAVKITKPVVLIQPGGPGGPRYMEWAYSTQWDVDRTGNVVGLIREFDGNGLPKVIDLQPSGSVGILTKENKIVAYRIGSKFYPPETVWHEKQYTVAGFPVGLSPVAYAAFGALGRAMSIEQFAQAWYAGGGVPRARLRNTQKKIAPGEGAVIKEAWKAAIAADEPFLHGADWEYDLIQGQESDAVWLDAMNASVPDVARFFDCPADLIDSIVQTGSRITYANITQKHLEFLVLHLAPAVARREDALSTLTQAPRFVRMATDVLLRMDPQTKAAWMKTLVDARLRAPSELRELDDLPDYTPAQRDEFLFFWPPKTAPASAAPKPGPAPAPGEPAAGEIPAAEPVLNGHGPG